MASSLGRAASFFVEGRYEDAAQAYTDELALLSDDLPDQRVEILCNRSACYLKLKQYGLVVEDCSLVLESNVSHQKAFSRKVNALRKLGYYSEAYDTACKWLRFNPESSAAQQQVERLQTVVDALDDPDEDIDGDLLSDEITGERIPPEGREDEISIRSPINLAGINSRNNLSKEDEKTFYCEFCGITFKTKRELALHCRSDLHRKKIVSDEGRDWKYRQPPRGLTGEEYELCQRFADNGQCRLGDRCINAHSESELAEWKERFEFKKSKVQKAKETMLVGNSYSDLLMERLVKAEKPELVMVPKLDSVNFMCTSSLTSITTCKRFSECWLFIITSRDALHRVCLLDDQHRNLFTITLITVGPKKMQKAQTIDDNCQEWSNTDTADSGPNTAQKVYRVKVSFRTEIYGTFRQTIVFDFGSEPVLVKEVCVDSAPVTNIDQLSQQITCILDVPRWDTTKIPLVEFTRASSSPQSVEMMKKEKELTAQYAVPHASVFIPSQAVLNPRLNKDNYRARMHDLLYIEEMAQYSSIARYNVKTRLQLVQRFLLIPGQTDKVRHADAGELIARMKLNSDLCEDTLHGRLILQNVFTIYLAPYNDKKKKDPDVIYEAFVEDRGKDFLMLRLSPDMVRDQRLRVDTEISFLVQFHLNRVPLCQMHLALDRLEDPGILFPDRSQLPTIPWTPRRQWSEQKDCKLNAKQREAVVAITTSSSVQLPPVLIVGPYGTGKTYTLAQAAKHLLQNDASRILICTHSNSAADLYIRDYFHPCVEDDTFNARPLRIYYRHRRVDTVDSVVIQYCLIDSRGANEVYFRVPTKKDIEKHRVVVATLSTSQDLYDLDLPKGYFTHILLDEAAQAMESETIMPITLAGPQTRVVLAGDHMQMSPEVHSEFTRERNLHISLLERLYDLYPNTSPVKILLCENYRSHKAIIDFTSELFYDSKLITSGKQPRHELFHPLTFFTTRGEDEQHQNSTAYYNNAEVYEVVERVVELRNNWPTKIWGPFKDSSIGVVAPYHDQVTRIRSELRKKKLYKVSVERVFNVQGKQFRVIIISTVRTRKTCVSESGDEDQMDYGFLSNAKLLNTAITRAQSLVAVVGDPVSLCSVGKCRKLWERFIEICSGNQSLYGITWNQLRAQLDSVEMKKTYTLNPLAPEFVPNRLRHPIPGDVSMGAVDLNILPIPMQQGVPHWMTRLGPPMIPPMYRFPQVLPHHQPWGHPTPHAVMMPGFYQVRPNFLGMPYVMSPPLPPASAAVAGSGPPSPAHSKDTIPISKEPGSGASGVDSLASKCPVHPPVTPHMQAILNMQAKGLPFYIHGPGPPQPVRGMLPQWTHPYVGQPMKMRFQGPPILPQHHAGIASAPMSPASTSSTNDDATQQASWRLTASLSPRARATPSPRSSGIQLLPNVRHVPPHLQASLIRPQIAMQKPAHPQPRPEQGAKMADAMVTRSPHLQREFYSYIMQSEGVDAANSFLKSVQHNAQMGASSPTNAPSPIPLPNPGRMQTKNGREAEVSCSGLLKKDYQERFLDDVPEFDAAMNNYASNKGMSPASPQQHNMVQSSPPLNDLNRPYHSNIQTPPNSGARAGQSELARGGQTQNIDFSVPTDIDRILKMMEDSVSKQAKEQSPFDVSNLVQPPLEDELMFGDNGSSPGQRTAPPLYMRGNDMGGRQESTSPQPMSYAAVLRRQPLPTATPPPAEEENKPEDPLDLLKNLNIKASPGTQALYQYFS